MCQEFGQSIPVIPTTVTIVEGSYACHPKLRNYYDWRIFMTVHPEEQMHRLYMRDGDYAEVFRDKWIPLEELYVKNCRVLDCCDRVYEIIE